MSNRSTDPDALTVVVARFPRPVNHPAVWALTMCLALLVSACGNGPSPLARIDNLDSANIELESGDRTYDGRSDSRMGLAWGRSDASILQRFEASGDSTVNEVQLELLDAVLADGWILSESSDIDPDSPDCCRFISEKREIDGFWFILNVRPSSEGRSYTVLKINQTSQPTN